MYLQTIFGANMGTLISTGPCPNCHRGQNTHCFAIYDNGEKCWSCGHYKAYGDNPFASRTAAVKKNADIPIGTTNLNNFSLECLDYLFSSYITQEIITEYQIMHIAGENGKQPSLIFPVIKNKEIISCQQRYFPSKKILTFGDKKSTLRINKHKTDSIVLVEDFISAVRVGQVENSICLSGTTLTYDNLDYILDNYSKIILWLDGDRAGQEASSKIIKKIQYSLKLTSDWRRLDKNYSITSVNTTKDPKHYSTKEIKETLYA